MEAITADLSKLTTRQSMSRYNLDSRLDNVINTGGGLESIYGQRHIRKTEGPVRAMHRTSIGRDNTDSVNDGNIYIVAGRMLYKLHSNISEPPLHCGELLTDSGTVTFAESQGQNIREGSEIYLYICDQLRLYRIDIMNPSAKIELIPATALPIVNGTERKRGIPSYISFRGHRILLTCSNSTQFFYSMLNPDILSHNDLIGADENGQPAGLPAQIFKNDAFYSTEAKADKTQRLIGLDLIYAFGTKTVEVWRDNNDNYDPYTTSINSAYLEGTAFPRAIAILGNEAYYFDSLRRLCRMAGGRRDVLSDRAMERVWDGRDFSNAFAIYTNGCHIAVFQTDDGFTIGYNTKSGSISELSCLSNVAAVSEGYLCDRDGYLCEFDDNAYTMPDGSVIEKTVQLEVVHSINRFSLRGIMIDYSIKTVPDNAALNNQVFLQVSPDGLTWHDRRILSLDLHSKTVKAYGFGLCGKMHARLIFTNANPVVFNSVTFLTEASAK
jgi:hypothetical protein